MKDSFGHLLPARLKERTQSVTLISPSSYPNVWPWLNTVLYLSPHGDLQTRTKNCPNETKTERQGFYLVISPTWKVWWYIAFWVFPSLYTPNLLAGSKNNRIRNLFSQISFQDQTRYYQRVDSPFESSQHDSGGLGVDDEFYWIRAESTKMGLLFFTLSFSRGYPTIQADDVLGIPCKNPSEMLSCFEQDF